MPSSSRLETRDDELCRNVFLITLCPQKEKKSALKLRFIIWFLSLPAKSNSFHFVLRPSFLPLLLPKVVSRTAPLQSYPFFDMLGAPAPANKINSSGLDYTGIDWRNTAPV